jgi:CDP-archaeol synthase
MPIWPILQSMLLLTLANGAPVIAKKILAAHWAWPLDAGMVFLDGRPWLGPSKTIRGVVASIAVTAVGAALIGLDLATGALVALFAMAGDLCSSFVKRRLNYPSSSQAFGVDQVPESLLPLLACRTMLSLTPADVAICVVLFLVGELIVSRLLYTLRVRDQPY